MHRESFVPLCVVYTVIYVMIRTRECSPDVVALIATLMYGLHCYCTVQLYWTMLTDCVQCCEMGLWWRCCVIESVQLYYQQLRRIFDLPFSLTSDC